MDLRLGPQRGDGELLRVLDEEFARAATAAGGWLLCKPGCDDCCHGPFPITRLDERRLAGGLEQLAQVEPALTGRILKRARAAVGKLTEGFPGDPKTGRLSEQTARLDRFFERHTALACPALDPVGGRCELYAWRPVACRTYGPPLRFAGRDVAPCDLCFAGAPPETVERCRVEPDADGIEQTLLAQIGVTPGREWETLIAFALTRGADRLAPEDR